MSRRGQISIDRIVALRSSVLPLYIVISPDGSPVTSDEVSEDGNDFLTTRMQGDSISFQSIRGYYLSAEGDQVCTRRYCSANERFTVERLDTQYAFRARSGKYLSVLDQAPFLDLVEAPGETEMFQLFSLMMYGVNVGKQLDTLEKTGAVQIDGLIDNDQLAGLRDAVTGCGGTEASGVHEVRCDGLSARSKCFAELAAHPLVVQLSLRTLSPSLRLSEMESCCTNADHVRKELEETTWHVNHPYSSVEFPGAVDARISITATWFLDTLDEENSTWAFTKAPLSDGAHMPMLPHLSSPEDVQAVVKNAQPLRAPAGSVWLYIGPVWMTNNVGAASFWRDYDAQARYKHLSGQKETTSFRTLTDSTRSQAPNRDLCPTLLQATYVREYVIPRNPAALQVPPDILHTLPEPQRSELARLVQGDLPAAATSTA